MSVKTEVGRDPGVDSYVEERVPVPGGRGTEDVEDVYRGRYRSISSITCHGRVIVYF